MGFFFFFLFFCGPACSGVHLVLSGGHNKTMAHGKWKQATKARELENIKDKKKKKKARVCVCMLVEIDTFPATA